jgi:hypothetical protein
MVIDVKRIRRRLVFSPPHAVSFSNDDFTANMHRQDAGGAENLKHDNVCAVKHAFERLDVAFSAANAAPQR